MGANRSMIHFTEAMKVVYGNVDHLSEEAARRWTAPDKPGAGGHHGRYLWTDAFGVVNFITLSKETSSPVYLTLAKQLAHTVHNILGRTRDGTARLPRATDAEPLNGGLRIGKVADHGPDCDGQYHHYLTLWMFALNRLALATGEKEYNQLAVQLAKAIHPHFVIGRDEDEAALHMVWKVSTDMDSVLVSSEGHLDAATGWVVYRLLQRTAEHLDGPSSSSSSGVLSSEIADYERLMGRSGGKLHASRDPLDLGMGLWMCHFFRDEEWAMTLGSQSLEMARMVVLDREKGLMARDASRRLAFREFGTCLGLQCYGADDEIKREVEAVVNFWHHYIEESTDEDLRPISLVMYAAALIPGGEFPDPVGQRRLPAIFARGGTSNGLVLWKKDLPRESECSFVQVGVKDGRLDMAGNCGNMLSIVGPIAFDHGFYEQRNIRTNPKPGPGTAVVRLRNTNTSKVVYAKFLVAGDPLRYSPQGHFEIDGVHGKQSRIDLTFIEPGGAKTGRTLPTGNPVDTLNLPDGSTIEASLVDVSNPGVFVRASDLGLQNPASLDPAAVGADAALRARLEEIRQAGASMMGLDPKIESVPKIVLVSPPAASPQSSRLSIKCLALSMGQAHKAVPLTLGLCLGTAARLPGTIPNQLAVGTAENDKIIIEHPAGKLDVNAKVEDGVVRSANLWRTARVLMEGDVYY
ncbi:PrpF protein-domain-containing protein [Chaetomidium leptoderma]|uniref:PrpF protein-domain-containing protein n=1 Tax=Chaetomidium leptoderma TaxID=669021 RepID=A0AAN6VDR7_9PEZI|nr:PrpF protein-domain-containing protein [Chaetomidium leptoderma]